MNKKKLSFKNRFKLVRNSTKRDKVSCEFFEFYKNKKIKYSNFKKFHNSLKNPRIICTINFGRVGSQYFFEKLNKKLDLICGPNLFNKRNKKKFSKHKNFEDFLFYNLKKIKYNNVIFFEISPKRFLKLIEFLEIKIIRKINFHVLYRKNKFEQTLSYLIAMNSGVWSNFDEFYNVGLNKNINYIKIKSKLNEILKNIIIFEKKIYTFLKMHNFNYSKNNYENIVKKNSYEVNKFIKFYNLKNKSSKKKIYKNYIIKNIYAKKYYKILKEFKNDSYKKLNFKNRSLF
tara:strand:- start:1564 stop:2424 length:861 start_codon:yes stop_codon:yes gene_type:complete